MFFLCSQKNFNQIRKKNIVRVAKFNENKCVQLKSLLFTLYFRYDIGHIYSFNQQ